MDLRFRLLTWPVFVAAAAALLTSIPGRAADKKDFAGYTKYVWYHAHYDVNADGTDVETKSWALKVLSQQGVEGAQRASVSFSDRLEKMDVTSAYTLKPDGRKIQVPATNYQDETNTGKGTATPMFSDIRTKTVAFPDVGVSDTVVLESARPNRTGPSPARGECARSSSARSRVVYRAALVRNWVV